MKKTIGNTPSAYQTISRFCEERSFQPGEQPLAAHLTGEKKSALNALKSLMRNPLRRKIADSDA